jgi:hypothetical protein
MPVVNHPACPEFMAPSLNPPTRGAINRGDARSDIDALLADQKTAWNFAVAHNLAILSVNADRNGAYLVVTPNKDIYKLFGDECGMWRRHVEGGLTTEHWIGCIGHIRVFWREVKCVH